jgi:protein-S-isoprenylcysteine O-methyltransferase Ste14
MSLSFLLLFFPVPGLRGRLLPLTPVVTAIGLTVQGLSFLLAVWARRHLGRNWSGAITVAQDHQLVRSGPYRLVRHPIYTAMFGMFLGSGIVSGELHALLAVALIVGAYWRKIRLEERTLREVFGPAYGAYSRETRALIPFLL